MRKKTGFRQIPTPVGNQLRARSQSNITQFIESVLARFDQRIVEKRLTVEVDLDVSTPELSQGLALQDAFEQLLSLVIERCPFGGELLITALESETGLEIEFADSGEEIPLSLRKSRLNAFGPAVVGESTLVLWPQRAQQQPPLDCQVFCTRCPQGGLAWTIVQPRRKVAQKVA